MKDNPLLVTMKNFVKEWFKKENFNAKATVVVSQKDCDTYFLCHLLSTHQHTC